MYYMLYLHIRRKKANVQNAHKLIYLAPIQTRFFIKKNALLLIETKKAMPFQSIALLRSFSISVLLCAAGL